MKIPADQKASRDLRDSYQQGLARPLQAGRPSKICRSFARNKANMTEQPLSWSQEAAQQAVPRGNMQLGCSLLTPRRAALQGMWPDLSISHFHPASPIAPGDSRATGVGGGWPGHASAAAAAVTHTAFLGPCSPGTVSAKDIRKLAREKVAPRRRAGQPGEGNNFCFSATAPEHLM